MVAEVSAVAGHGSPGVPARQGGAGSQALLPCPVTMAVFVHSWAPTGAALGP